MTSLVVATRNRGKLKEIKAFLEGLVVNIHCAADFEGFPDTVEDGATFELNALKKAREAVCFTGLSALADDSGLVVDALDGRPGVYSARFAGDAADDDANNRKLLKKLEGVPSDLRQCAFVCSMVFVSSDGCELTFTGRIAGRILDEGRGKGGFGYDSLFLVDGFDRTMAELSIEEKNRISHRGQALLQFSEYLETHK
jgi:XTP/dITP diphosphohydrolase